MITQRRRTAGIRITHQETQVHIDPGPGALVFSNWAKQSPRDLDGLILTHNHPDHYSDAEVFIEAMTNGTTEKKGVLAAPKTVLRGHEGIGPSISRYHQNLIRTIIELEPETRFNVDHLTFTAVKALHSDPKTVGIRLDVPEIGSIGYTSDTSYYTEIGENYKDQRLLILCTIWPRNNPINQHLNIDNALNVIESAKPRCVVLTHFGIRMLNKDPETEAKYLQETTGVPVIAATDGLKVTLHDRITFKGARKSDVELIIDA